MSADEPALSSYLFVVGGLAMQPADCALLYAHLDYASMVEER